MGHLDKLTVSNRAIAAPKSQGKSDSIEHRRKKLIANLEEQIELAEKVLNGEPPALQRKRGHEVKEVKPRLWWKEDHTGMVLTQIRYNKLPLDLNQQGKTVEVSSLKKLPAAYRTVIRAVKAGELDKDIEKAAAKLRRLRR